MLDQQKLNQLTEVSSPNSISFYLPTHRVDGIQEDKIRYKNSISEVKSVLADRDFNDQEINKTLKEAEEKPLLYYSQQRQKPLVSTSYMAVRAVGSACKRSNRIGSPVRWSIP